MEAQSTGTGDVGSCVSEALGRCPICKDILKTQNVPKLLNCLHSVCNGCIQPHVKGEHGY